MKRLNIEEYRKEFEDLFGRELTTRQLWLLVKMCKNVRLRCRNNSAFNNFMNQMFGPRASFRTVAKTVPDWKNPGHTKVIDGLSIVVAGVAQEDQEEEGED